MLTNQNKFKGLFFKLVNLLLYSNFWIAAAALAMALQTQVLTVGSWTLLPIHGFIFFSTVFVYALHRVIGLRRVQAFRKEGRYRVVHQFRAHIALYSILSGILSIVFFFRLSMVTRLWVILPALVSLLYVLPTLGNSRKRLRDYSYLKIFLIALIWPIVTVVLPAAELGLERQLSIWLMIPERIFFIFALALPFDIRDIAVDLHSRVWTIPARIGVKNTVRLSLISLAIAALFSWISYSFTLYSFNNFLALIVSFSLSGIIVGCTSRFKHDYYFAGLIDGAMILQFSFVWLLGR